MVVKIGQRPVEPYPKQRIKYGERVIDLATHEWKLVTNVFKDGEEEGLKSAIEEATNYWKAPEFETHIEGIAYESSGKFAPDLSGIYIRGELIRPKVERRVVLEAWDFLEKDEISQVELLMNVYNQIVTSNSGEYAQRLNQQQEGIAVILHYFADKIRVEDRKKARRLEFEIFKRF